MEHKKYLSFRGKNEYTLIRERTEKYGLGKLMFAFMDVEWQKRRDELADLKERCYVENIDQEALLNMQDDSKNYIVLGAYYKALYDELNTLHPFLGQTVDEMLEAAVDEAMNAKYARQMAVDIMLDLFRNYLENKRTTDRLAIFQEEQTSDYSLVEATNELFTRLCTLTEQMAAFKENLLLICGYALDREAENASCKPIERYYDMLTEEYEPLLRVQKAAGLPFMEQRIIWEDDLETEKEDGGLIAHGFYTANDIRTLIFAEFQYMSANNHVISKCQYCKRYFCPHSKASIYCDRLADETSGKACKEFASTDKYLRGVSANEAKVLYGKYRNNYQMRVRRNPEDFSYSDYVAWMDKSKALLKDVRDGRMSLEEFDREIALPTTKEARGNINI